MTSNRTWRGRAFLGMSVDGYIARSNGDVSWLENLSPDAAHVTTSTDYPALVWETFFPDIDTLLMGRATYEKVLTFGDWPFAGTPTIVLSSTLETDDGNIEVVRSTDEADRLLTVRNACNVYVDGGATVRSFLRLGLLDELTISIAPIILGDGVPLFETGIDGHTMKVRGAHVTEEGLVRITYAID